MAEMKRYDICAVIDENRNGEYVLYSDHLAALKAAVEKEREACAFVCQDVMPVKYESPPSFAERLAKIIRARGAAHD